MAAKADGSKRTFSQTLTSGEQTSVPVKLPKPTPTNKLLNSREKQDSKPATTPQPTTFTNAAADEEKAARWSNHHEHYERFLAEAEYRRQKRADLKARNRIWHDKISSAKDRLEAMERERVELLERVESMEVLRERYNRENAVAIAEESDVERKEEWEGFFALERNEAPV